MSASAIEAGKAFLKLLVDDTDFRKGFQGAQRQLEHFGKSVLAVGASIGAAGASITAPFLESLHIFSEVGEQLDKMSQRTGITVEALSELKFAAIQSGSDLESFEVSIRKMQKALGAAENGGFEAAQAFTTIGLSISELQGLSPDKQFEKIAEAIGLINDPTQRAAAAIAIFGKTGTSILPMIENLAELRQQARDLGITMDENTAKAASRLHEALNALKQQFAAISIAIASAVSPQVSALSETISRTLPVVIDWLKQNGLVLEVIFALGLGLTALGTVIATVGGGLLVIVPIMVALGAAVNPATIAIVGLTAGLLQLGPQVAH